MTEYSKFYVDHHLAVREHETESFQDLMAEQLRHAPWLMLSVVVHALVFLLLYLMPNEPLRTETPPIVLTPPEQVQEIETIEEPKEDPKPEETQDEPVLVDTQIDEVTDEPVENFDEVTDAVDKQAAFNGPDWNSAVGLGGAAGGPYGGRGSGRGGPGTGGRRTAVAIESALKWLQDHQDEDGRWDADDFMKHDTDGEPCDGPGTSVHDVGVTGLALLAFLGDGNTLASGPYKDVVKNGVRWLRMQQDPQSGLFGTNNSNEFIYNHAIATLAMVEAYGLSEYSVLRKNAQDGINYLEFHRNPYNVWRYQPRDGDNDTSVTGWAVMAYKSAKDFGLDVNEKAFGMAETWLDAMTDPATGRTGYTERGGLSSRRAGDHATLFPREKGECMTGVSLLVRFFLGNDPKDDKTMGQQADLLLKKQPTWNENDGSIDHYYWYYATYALYQMGGRHWTTWEKALKPAVVDSQRGDGNFTGSWDAIGAWGEDGGRVYSTALLCLTLEAYYRYTRLVR